MSASHLTIGEICVIYDQPAWKVRRVVDSLDASIPRAGLYRLVPRELLADIGIALNKQRRQQRTGAKHA